MCNSDGNGDGGKSPCPDPKSPQDVVTKHHSPQLPMQIWISEALLQKLRFQNSCLGSIHQGDDEANPKVSPAAPVSRDIPGNPSGSMSNPPPGPPPVSEPSAQEPSLSHLTTTAHSWFETDGIEQYSIFPIQRQSYIEILPAPEYPEYDASSHGVTARSQVKFGATTRDALALQQKKVGCES